MNDTLELQKYHTSLKSLPHKQLFVVNSTPWYADYPAYGNIRIGFIGPFPKSSNHEYILVAVNYVSKWVEAIPTQTCDVQVILKFIQENILSKFGFPRAIISNREAHFCNKLFEKLMKKYGINHKIATPYQPQTSRQVETINKQIKGILERTVQTSPKDWSIKFSDTSWEYQTAYKFVTGINPYCPIFEKSCHLPVGIEHKSYKGILYKEKVENIKLDFPIYI